MVSKTSRVIFSIGLLVWKLQLGVGFYSVFDDFELLRRWWPGEGIKGVVVLQYVLGAGDTSTLGDKTDPRSIGPRVLKLGVHFYS